MRERASKLWPIALSPASLADVLDVDRRVIDRMIRFGQLPIYQIGTKRRVLIEDAVNAIRKYWKPARKS
jgi:excisionase family DNA binding protein